MPEIKLQHVVSCSSEDRSYAAENLINGGGFKKWKGASAGEKNVSVTIQLEKSSKIQQIDIGNEGSAFVEVLVGKSSSKDDEFQVLLVASAFMTPLDSRAAKNTTSVRMFGPEKLSKNAADEKWDRVKVVCTQPFNKTTPYGLAFIKLHSSPEEASSTTQPPKQAKLGAFKLKSEEPDSIKAGGLFTSRDKAEISSPSLTGAAAVRAASKLAEESKPAPTKVKDEPRPQSTPKQVKRKHDDDDRSSPAVTSKRQSLEKRPDESKQKPAPPRKQSTASSTSSSGDRGSIKKTKSEPSPRPSVRLSAVMRRVVFVMSGFQNPLRGELRDKAIEMGAEYKPDWGRHCTHLICAFENTPKYAQIQGKGRIVTKDWVNDCHRAKKLLPWRKYRLGRAKSPGGSSSESEDEAPEVKPKTGESSRKREAEKKEAPRSAAAAAESSDSGDDTEDEIQRVKAARPPPPRPSEDDDDIYDASTDEEMTSTANGSVTNGAADVSMNTLPDLPDYFKRRKFFLYGNFEPTVQRKLKRFIIAYNGVLEQYMSDTTTYVVTESPWDDNFDQALSDNPSLAFIRPDWVFACDDKEKLLPYQKYVVVPQ